MRLFCGLTNGKSCRRAEKGGSRPSRRRLARRLKPLKYKDIQNTWDGPVLADRSVEFHRQRPPVQSVASEAATSMSFQGPSPRPARSSSDPSLGNTLFASMVDGNAATDARSAPNQSQDQSAPPRRSDNNNSTTPDNSRSRETAPAGQSANADSVNNNQDASAAPPPAAGAGATTDTAIAFPEENPPARKPTAPNRPPSRHRQMLLLQPILRPLPPRRTQRRSRRRTRSRLPFRSP